MDEMLLAIKESFKTPDLIGMWPIIKHCRDVLCLGDKLSDDELIRENTWIVQQYRKYIFSKQEQILSYKDDLQGMYLEVEGLIESATEKAEDRKHLLYNMLRDQWLMEMYQLIALAIENNDDEGRM